MCVHSSLQVTCMMILCYISGELVTLEQHAEIHVQETFYEITNRCSYMQSNLFHC